MESRFGYVKPAAAAGSQYALMKCPRVRIQDVVGSLINIDGGQSLEICIQRAQKWFSQVSTPCPPASHLP